MANWRDDGDDSYTLSRDDLRGLAEKLYGTEADLWTISSSSGSRGRSEPGDLRWHLRTRTNLVQDPITRVWFCPNPVTRRELPAIASLQAPGEREGEGIETKVLLREWLQAKLDAFDCREEYGHLWREIEIEGPPHGVTLAVDHCGSDLIFGLRDGLLASRFEIGADGEVLWYFIDGQVESNLRDYSPGEVECALWRARGAVSDLQRLLTLRQVQDE